MSRLRHWQIWLPRLLLVAVVLLAVQYVLGRMTRSKFVESGQAMFGAKVDVGHALVSVTRHHVSLRDVCVTDPRRPLTNFVEAERCEFDLATGPLLHKRTEIERGSVTGLRFATPRE